MSDADSKPSSPAKEDKMVKSVEEKDVVSGEDEGIQSEEEEEEEEKKETEEKPKENNESHIEDEAMDTSTAKEDNNSEADDEDDKEDKSHSTKKEESSPKAESEEEEMKLGLLEQPVVIESGKREKKKVERLSMTGNFTPSEKKKVEIPEGRGKRLVDIPKIEHNLSNTKADELKPLYIFLFARLQKVSPTEMKKNIRSFCGFAFEKDDSEYQKKQARLNKNVSQTLKQMCKVLELERGGTKEALSERIMDFCLCPVDSGKKLPAPKKRSKSSSKSKSEKQKPSAKKAKQKKKAGKKDSEGEEEEEDDEEEEEEEEEVEEEEEEEEVEPPKKKAKKQTKAATPKNNKKQKEQPAKKTPAKKKKAESDEDDEESDDDEPLVKKAGPPSNDEIKDVVKKLLDDANLEEVTMKTVVKQVYAKYPKYDLSDRKDFIKNTVKQIIS